MKKCPKCGTILDDSKKTCYMCGAELVKSNAANFGDSFNAQIGATMSMNQNNVFGNGNNFNTHINDVNGINTNNGMNRNGMINGNVSNNMNSMNNNMNNMYNNMNNNMNRHMSNNMYNGMNNNMNKMNNNMNNKMNRPPMNKAPENNLYQNQLNSLNSLSYDERSNIEKIIDSGGRKKSKNPLKENPLKEKTIFKSKKKASKTISNKDKKTSNLPNKNNQPNNGPMPNNSNNTNNNNNAVNNNLFNEAMNYKVNVVDNGVNKEKPSINWGDDLTNQSNDVWRFKDRVDKKRAAKINLNTILNFVCLIVCIVGVIFVYNKFLKDPKSDDLKSFGGLKYQINDKLTLKSHESNSRYYTYNEGCAIRINYGTTPSPDSFVENYFNQVKETYANQDNYTTSVEKMMINDNEWQELSILTFKEDAGAKDGFSLYFKYKHIAVVHNSNYYDIVFTNIEDDKTCMSMYQDLIKSLEFE